MKHYSFEKGKHGGVVGTIHAFTSTLVGNTPSNPDWKTKVPAGFLRCDGSVVSADLYPALADVLGVGEDSFYRKTGQTLAERNADGTGGQFQLPDIGSKYIRASSQGSGYNDLLVTTTNGANQRRVGIAVDLNSNLGTGNTVNATVVYNGSFAAPARTLTMSGNFSLTMNAATGSSNVTIDQILPHGHFANTVSIEDPTNKRAGDEVDNGQNYSAKGQWDVEAVTSFVPSTGLSLADTAHDHLIERTTISRSLTPTVPAFNVSAENISTSVTLRVDDTYVMNDIQSRFILVEYLIKF
jgi:hypothetical protein